MISSPQDIVAGLANTGHTFWLFDFAKPLRIMMQEEQGVKIEGCEDTSDPIRATVFNTKVSDSD